MRLSLWGWHFVADRDPLEWTPVTLGIALIELAVVLGLLYIAYHFIHKYW
jgi:hypothetical protein